MVYGWITYGRKEFLNFLNIKQVEPLSGDFRVKMFCETDKTEVKAPMNLHHDAKMSGGGMETLVADADDSGTKILAQGVKNHRIGRRTASLAQDSPGTGFEHIVVHRQEIGGVVFPTDKFQFHRGRPVSLF
jgi:hypothetical protein